MAGLSGMDDLGGQLKLSWRTPGQPWSKPINQKIVTSALRACFIVENLRVF